MAMRFWRDRWGRRLTPIGTSSVSDSVSLLAALSFIVAGSGFEATGAAATPLASASLPEVDFPICRGFFSARESKAC